MSWRDGVVYQIYPRSFQDSDGDGVGDLPGITSRLGHLEDLGVDALWLSPFFPSPLADFGYDVSDYTAVDPQFGTLADFDRLVSEAHRHGIKVLLDLVACHTSIEHPWFREHPDWYVRVDGERPPNNWTAAFGGPAWSRDSDGRWYLHSFYPEQPDLDWRNPEVVSAMQGVVRFWRDRGVDGFRLDAIDRLMKDPQLRDDPISDQPFGLPLLEHELGRDLCHSRNSPDVGLALAALREAAGHALLIGEVYQPTSRCGPYLEQLDRTFIFELLMVPWEADRIRAVIDAGATLEGRAGAGAAWVMSNHDFGRLSSRYGRENERAAAVLVMTLPGTAFLYQGDEIGQANGPGADRSYDRIGRDSFRHPMQWDGSQTGGFSAGTTWLPLVDPAERNVEAQAEDPKSLLALWRRLMKLRRRLDGPLREVGCDRAVLTYRRGDHVVAINFSGEQRPGPAGELVLSTHEGSADGMLAPHAAAISRG